MGPHILFPQHETFILIKTVSSWIPPDTPVCQPAPGMGSLHWTPWISTCLPCRSRTVPFPFVPLVNLLFFSIHFSLWGVRLRQWPFLLSVCGSPLFPSSEHTNTLKPLPIKTTIRINLEVWARHWYFKSSPGDSKCAAWAEKDNNKVQTVAEGLFINRLLPVFPVLSICPLSWSHTKLPRALLHTHASLCLECLSLPSRKCPLILSLGVISVKASRTNPHLRVRCPSPRCFHNLLDLSLWGYSACASLIVHLYVCFLD